MTEELQDTTVIIRDRVLNVYEHWHNREAYDDYDRFIGWDSYKNKIVVVPEEAIEDFEVSVGESGGYESAKLLFKLNESDLMKIVQQLRQADALLTSVRKHMKFPHIVRINSQVTVIFDVEGDETVYRIDDFKIDSICNALHAYGRENMLLTKS